MSNAMKTYRVTVYMKVPITTVVQARSEKAAKKIAALREGPVKYSYHVDPAEEEWVLGDVYNHPGEDCYMEEAEIDEE